MHRGKKSWDPLTDEISLGDGAGLWVPGTAMGGHGMELTGLHGLLSCAGVTVVLKLWLQARAQAPAWAGQI